MTVLKVKLVGLLKCTELFVGMSDVSPLVSVLFSPILLAWFLLKRKFMLVIVPYLGKNVLWPIAGMVYLSITIIHSSIGWWQGLVAISAMNPFLVSLLSSPTCFYYVMRNK